MGRELELKFAATPAILETICCDGENWTKISMETAYFDTDDGALAEKKCTLRQRMEDGISICTMKTPADGFGRGEWSLESPWNEETVKTLLVAAGKENIPFDKLHSICGARFTRLAKTVAFSLCTVEIALDQGVLFGGGREIPLCEVEVEYKSGEENAAISWARAFAQHYGLQPEQYSKFYRARSLAKGE